MMTFNEHVAEFRKRVFIRTGAFFGKQFGILPVLLFGLAAWPGTEPRAQSVQGPQTSPVQASAGAGIEEAQKDPYENRDGLHEEDLTVSNTTPEQGPEQYVQNPAFSVFSSTITSRQADLFTDYSVQDALARLPGIQVDRRRNIFVRGLGPGRYNVTVDGQAMATNGFGDRSVDLYALSMDLVSGIELHSVTTPNMEAGALGGTINLVTSEPADVDRDLRIIAGGGGNTSYFNQAGPDTRFSVHYAETPRDDFAFVLGIMHEQDRRAWESLGLDYAVENFGGGLRDVMEEIRPGLHRDGQQRFGGTFQATYRPDDITTLNLRGMFNRGDREYNRNHISWVAGGDWVRPDSTGAEGGQGLYEYKVSQQNKDVSQYLLRADASHSFDRLHIHYDLGWAYGHVRQHHDALPYQLDALDFAIDMTDRTRPAMQVTNIPLMEDGTIDPRRIEFKHIDRIFDDHTDNTLTGNLDLEVPAGPAEFRVGGSAKLTTKQGDFNDSRYSYLRRLTLDQFNLERDTDFEVFNTYFIPRFVDVHNARRFFTGSRPTFILDERRHFSRSEIRNYDASENIYAAYGMVTFNVGNWSLSGGVRLEHTDSRYDGRTVLFDDIGSFESAADTNSSVDYSHLFPNLQIGYRPFEHTGIRFAYSQNIQRPDFNFLAPFELTNEQDSTLFRGNPALDPVTSDNLDLIIEHRYHDSGILTVNIFHKEVAGLIREEQSIVNSGVYSGWSERKFRNSNETVTIYGAGASWLQESGLFPGVLRPIGFYANYTWSHSQYDAEHGRDDEPGFPGVSPHALNATMFYTYGRFSGQVSWHWTAPSLQSIEDERTFAPSIDGGHEVYMDRYADGWSDLSLSFRFRISSQFTFWANANNLLRSERILYEHSRSMYPAGTDYRDGIGFRAGLRYEL